ncbi:MFS transporter [Streptomyces spectabilis]|uniref:MFS family permease n=1 Tax=Streptomyces spectabilis TaxID=68270 RepID=A0A5P2X1L0_STRST|nr:MFS transporter [Streptomyces spectabilis]MBB5101556.1 MFS family permease [Streptomyces spectabilis]MCI3900740.1 MFS transporter [Streptomyces spectabilis]QEV58278.1 MFS transporter [Streptomyces spectabilis]GGV12131.1 MFS transporter [Streptomyces spectabilis]
MAHAYREIFSAPGAKAFSSAGLVARLPLPLTHMGILAMLSETTGEYALAGLVAGTFTFSMAFLGPQVSKAVDRRGQSRVLPVATGVSVLGLAGLLLCATSDAPRWTLFLFALLSGLMPSMSAMVRARWTELYRGRPQLTTAYSMESVVDELTYVISPALAVVLSTALFPQAAPMAAGLLLLVGVALFVPQKSTEPPVKPRTADGDGGSALSSPPVLVLALILLCGGTIPGMVDTMGLAFAEDAGNKSLAGLVFAVYAIGSGISGLLFGARRIDVPLPRLLLIGVTGTALTTLPFLLVDGVWGMVVVVFVAGVFFAPTMVVIMAMVERTTPEHQLTEAMTWMIAGLQSGVALGAAVTGVVYDHLGATAGVCVAVVAGALALLLTLCGSPMLRTRLAHARSGSAAVSAPGRGEPAVCR